MRQMDLRRQKEVYVGGCEELIVSSQLALSNGDGQCRAVGMASSRQVRAAVTQTRGETEGTDGWISSGVRRELARELHL